MTDAPGSLRALMAALRCLKKDSTGNSTLHGKVPLTDLGNQVAIQVDHDDLLSSGKCRFYRRQGLCCLRFIGSLTAAILQA